MVGFVIDYISTRLQSDALIWLASETTGAWPVYTKMPKDYYIAMAWLRILEEYIFSDGYVFFFVFLFGI